MEKIWYARKCSCGEILRISSYRPIIIDVEYHWWRPRARDLISGDTAFHCCGVTKVDKTVVGKCRQHPLSLGLIDVPIKYVRCSSCNRKASISKFEQMKETNNGTL